MELSSALLTLVAALGLVSGVNMVLALTYENHRLFSVKFESLEQYKTLEDFSLSTPGINILNEPFTREASVVVAPEQETVFRSKFGGQESGIEIELVSENVQSLIDEENEGSKEKRATTSDDVIVIDHARYYKYPEIVGLMGRLAHLYPDLMVVSNLTHTTYENRHVILVKLRGSRTRGENKPAIVLEAGVHSREWISPAVNLWVLEHLLEGYSTGDKAAQTMLDTFDWYIIPVANPDGYVYCHETDRFWRKNRRNVGYGCYGVDVNRNFDVNFDGEGYSWTCRRNVYPGQSAFSEPESLNIKELVESLKDRLAAFLSVHSYAKTIILPWAYSKDKHPDNIEELKDIATSMQEGFRRRYSTEFRVEADLPYTASGTSMDWALKAVPGIFSSALELRSGQDTHPPKLGFVVKPGRIVPMAEEYFDSLIEMTNKLKEKKT